MRDSKSASDQALRADLKVFEAVCESVDTPRSLACYMLGRYGEWSQYFDLSMPDPLVQTFPDDYLVSEMMRKNPRLPAIADTRSAAEDKFLDSERACCETNARLKSFLNGTISVPSDVRAVIANAQLEIQKILGPLTRNKLAYASSQFRFGPGATSSVSGSNVMLSHKMTCSMHVTPRLYPYLRGILGPVWGPEINDLTIRPYSKVTTVPKNCRTDRCIAVEPHVNVYVQLGIGALLRRQLLRAGLDLNDQGENQRLASRAHLDGLATIDLSSASDTIASELVWLMLPTNWAALLDLARTEYSEVRGEVIRLHKFSSMGNGYTFELESLIFWALARSCSDVSRAYGDDIIVRASDAPLLIRTLEFLGFSVNGKKTFLAGVFFESCGSDWWNGKNIRPFYLKGEVCDLDPYLIRIANAVSRYASRRSFGQYRDRRFLPAWLRAYRPISRIGKATYIGDGYGDDGIVRDFDDACPSRPGYHSRTMSGWDGWAAAVLRSKAKRGRTDILGAYLAALAWGSPDLSRGIEYLRGTNRVTAKLSYQVIPTWRDLGPWL
ncbi:MAG: RNA replicase beta chain [Sanya fiers-like virus 50]|nr:MAG: RNA replicase beta chain [Sanya fiers-like virus 50]